MEKVKVKIDFNEFKINKDQAEILLDIIREFLKSDKTNEVI